MWLIFRAVAPPPEIRQSDFNALISVIPGPPEINETISTAPCSKTSRYGPDIMCSIYVFIFCSVTCKFCRIYVDQDSI